MDSASPISLAVSSYLDSKRRSRSPQTARLYARVLAVYSQALADHGLDPAATPVSSLAPDSIPWLLEEVRHLSSSTEAIYVTVLSDFFRYLQSLDIPVNAVKVAYLLKAQSRRRGSRIPVFNEDDVLKLLDYASRLGSRPASDDRDRLINLRDRALLLTLAATGLRISEALHLLRGDIDYNNRQAVLVGKGDKQAVVRFSQESLDSIHDYLRARAPLDGASGRPLASLPLFARHDRGAGSRLFPLTSAGAEKVIHGHVLACLGPDSTITPHTLRHYFVTLAVRSSGIEVARRLARHESTQVTARYTHLSDQELDRAYAETFE